MKKIEVIGDIDIARGLISEMLEITDREMLTPEEESWRERAAEFLAVK